MSRILLIEDSSADALLIQEMLANAGGTALNLERADLLSAGLERLAAGGVDAVLLDLLLPDSQGLDTLARVQAQAPQVPIVILSNLEDERLAVEAVRQGAQDYLAKAHLSGALLVRAISYAIERKRAERELWQRNRELALLHRAGQALTSTLDLDQVLVTVLEEVRRLLGAVASSIWLSDPKTGELVCRQAAGPQSDIVRGWRLAPGEGLAGWVAQSGESLITPDIHADARYSGRVDRETGLRLRSILSVPLRAKDRIVGVLQVVDSEVNRFSAADLSLLEPLAATAAIAIENARLYEETDRLRAFNTTIVQSLEEGILLEEAGGSITFANPKAAELLGYSPEELVGRHWADIVAPGHEFDVEEESILRSHGAAIRYETALLTQDGREIPVIVSARSLYEEGRLTGVLSVFTDITARKQAEQEIKRRNKELSILNTIAAAVSRSLELGEVLDTALQEAGAALQAEGGLVYLTDETGRSLTLAAHRGFSPDVSGEVAGFRLGAWLSERVAQTGQPLFVSDVAEDLKGLFSATVQEEWHSLVSVPLNAKGRTVGVMTFVSHARGQFLPASLDLLTAIGVQIGMAVENARLFEAVRAGREQLRALSRRLVEVQESERRTIARELHDEIGQTLTGLSLALDMAARAPSESVGDRLREALALINGLMARVRDLSLDLRPTMLDDLGLLPALLWHLERYTAQTDVRVAFEHSDLEGRRFAPEVETAAYRIVQEALTNVARHAGVREARVHIGIEQDTLNIQVEDRGCGFDPETVLHAGSSSGLTGMRERAGLLNGRLTVESAPGAGTCLTAELPLHTQEPRR